VTWQPAASVTVHEDLITPDLTPIVNEIIALSGWAAGNSMGIMFGHVSGAGSRWVESSSTNNGIATPQLVIQPGLAGCTTETKMAAVADRTNSGEETVATGAMYLTSSDLEFMTDGGEQVVGIVFPGVDIAQGTTVTEAMVYFDIGKCTKQSDAT